LVINLIFSETLRKSRLFFQITRSLFSFIFAAQKRTRRQESRARI